MYLKVKPHNNIDEQNNNNNFKTKCGFIAIVGEPNVGKSTLINLIVGEKISIVSNKIQTTRRQIRGIKVVDNSQLVFIDTPGFCRANTSLEKALISNFRYAYKDADIILLMIDPTSKNHKSSFDFIEKIKNKDNILIVAINKIDAVKKESLLKLTESLSHYDNIKKIFMISALENDHVDDITNFLLDNIPESPFMYEEDRSTDMDIKFRLSEITREKIFNLLSKELPYSIYVETESFSSTDKKARIFQSIIVIKDSQKGIVLGKQGSKIKEIKNLAIFDMKKLLNKNIDLKLFVKVKEKWTEKRSHLQNAGIVD